MEQKIARQFRLWEQTHRDVSIGAEQAVQPCITISQELGSRGDQFAQHLSDRLGWELFDKQLVDFIAAHANVRKTIVERFDERTQNEIHNWVFTLLDTHALGSDMYFKHLAIVLLSIAERGQAIVLGRGGHMILPAEHTLRLRVVSPMQQRIATLCETEHLSPRQAKSRIVQSDKEKRTFIKRFFHVEWDSSLNYDLTLNFGNLDLNAAQAIVLDALQAKFPDIGECASAERSVQTWSAASSG